MCLCHHMRRRIHACHFYNQHDSLRSLNAHAFDTSNRPGRCASGHQHPSTRGFHLSWFEPLYSSARRRLSSPRRFSSPHPPPAISNFLCMILARTVPNPPQSPIIPLSPLRSNDVDPQGRNLILVGTKYISKCILLVRD